MKIFDDCGTDLFYGDYNFPDSQAKHTSPHYELFLKSAATDICLWSGNQAKFALSVAVTLHPASTDSITKVCTNLGAGTAFNICMLHYTP